MTNDDFSTLERALRPFDERLTKIAGMVGVSTDHLLFIRQEQENQGTRLTKVEHSMETLKDEIFDMKAEIISHPGKWKDEIIREVSRCQEGRNRMQDREEEITQRVLLQRRPSKDPKTVPESGINSVLKSLAPYILVGLATVGAWVAAKMGGPSTDDINKMVDTVTEIQHKIERQEVEKVSRPKTLEAVRLEDLPPYEEDTDR